MSLAGKRSGMLFSLMFISITLEKWSELQKKKILLFTVGSRTFFFFYNHGQFLLHIKNVIEGSFHGQMVVCVAVLALENEDFHL